MPTERIFSILHNENNKIELAPAYDILCASVYPELSNKMAMKIGGYYEANKIYPRHFERLANDVEMSYTQLKKIIKTQCEILPDIVKEVIDGFDNTIGNDILLKVQTNCQSNIKRFQF